MVQTYLPNDVLHLLYAYVLKVYFQVSPEDMPVAIEKLSVIAFGISD